MSSETLEAALPTIFDPAHPDSNQTIINDPFEESSSSHINPTPYASALKILALLLLQTLFKIPRITMSHLRKKRYDMLLDPVFLNSGLMP